MDKLSWEAIILAIIMATPPLLAQVVDGLNKLKQANIERRKLEADTGRTAVDEWKSLYAQCDLDRKALEEDVDRLRAERDAVREESTTVKERLRVAEEEIERLKTKPPRSRKKSSATTQ